MIKRHQLILPLFLFAQAASAYSQHPSVLRKRHGDHGADHPRDGEEADCYASGVDNWDVGLHVGAIFIILAVSGLGSFLPVLSHYIPSLRVPPTALTLGKFLGTGVIISTAFIHMLPSGSGSLNNPCVGDRLGSYNGWPGVLAIMAILAMHLMEFLLSNHTMGKHSHSHGLPDDLDKHTRGSTTPADTEAQAFDIAAAANANALTRHASFVNGSTTTKTTNSSEAKIAGTQPMAGLASGNGEPGAGENCDAIAMHTHHTHVHGLSFLKEDSESATAQKHRISTYILELGICLHSVIIGLTLSVTTGTDFKTLLVAISFHQFCEGLALGSRIAQMKYAKHSFFRALVNAAIFMLITPLGMIVGVGIRYSYQPNSPTALITMGVLDSLSAGILVYTGLVNLLAEEFGTLEFRSYSKNVKGACFIAMYVGAGLMALIGKWA
ncbi:ZIP zinc/iron transport family [Martensiomyces pterosporus]|nr:ZIP zinc/iron transport family [Martensiomyces pterosporus]